MTANAQDYLVTTSDGVCGAVIGLPEEVVAMLFAFFSRSSKTISESLQLMLDDGSIQAPPKPDLDFSGRARPFHTKTTIGYGHKSVADHATVHPYFEGVSMIAERDMMSARLIAATSKSTRYVNFENADVYVPPEIRNRDDQYRHHVSCLITEYSQLMPLAIEAVRRAFPYSNDWKRSSWENATEKRALDAIRDLLPSCVKTSFGMTMSATAAREFLDKRSVSEHLEIRSLSIDCRQVLGLVTPSLIPAESRKIQSNVFTPQSPTGEMLIDSSKIEVLQIPDWRNIEQMLGASAETLISTWQNTRGHHMPPDRSSELADYVFRVTMPFAIARDLGRHRMMTQIWSNPNSASPFGCDPILSDQALMSKIPQIGILSAGHAQALERARSRMNSLRRNLPITVDPYICPMATMVSAIWKVSLRELVHICGLRTTPQGHPSYRKFTQGLSKAIDTYDPIGGVLINSVTNFEDIFVGRPN